MPKKFRKADHVYLEWVQEESENGMIMDNVTDHYGRKLCCQQLELIANFELTKKAKAV